MQSVLNWLARVSLHDLGALRAMRRLSRSKLRILTYHRFSSTLYPGGQDVLAEHCAHLRRWYCPVALGDIGESLQSGKPLPAGAVAITVDDGYRDFLTEAFPVFQQWNIPVTVFLVTDFVDGELWQWWDHVDFAVKYTRLQLVRLALVPRAPLREIPLQSLRQRTAAVQMICSELKNLSNCERVAFIKSLPERFEVDIPRKAPPEYANLSWEDIRFLAASGVQFGAHTKTHPILSRLEHPNSLTEEIIGSKSRIEHMLQRPVSHFCYPNGQLADFNSAIMEMIASNGFQTAATTVPGLNARGADRYQLRRLSVDLTLTSGYFEELLCGLHAHTN